MAEITIRQYESNKRKPKIENLYKIAECLNITLQELNEGFQNIGRMLEMIKLKNQMENIQKEHKNDNREGIEEIKNVLQMTIDDLNIEINKEQQVLDQESGWLIEIEQIYNSLSHEAKETFKNIAAQFNLLNEAGRISLIEQTELLLKIPEYKNDNNSED